MGKNYTLERGSKIGVDADLVIADHLSTAITSTTTETAVAVPVRMSQSFKVGLFVSASDDTTGDETYVVSVEVSDASGGTFTEVGTFTLTRGDTGYFEIPLSGRVVEYLDSDSAYIRAKATLGGTTPSLKYAAYVMPA